MTKVRTRFAPSPTGYLHIGSLRTVLYAYLIARRNNGKFILRIEDTDKKRKVDDAEEKLLEILDWLKIDFDEGPHVGGKYGPYIQSERQDIYQKYIAKLLESGGAYHCFCSSEYLDEMRNAQQENKLPPRYNRHCRNLTSDEIESRLAKKEKYVIRQKMPKSGEVIVHDELRGDIKFRAEDLEDHVLIKSNGVPTYQFASVVDDYLMEISHVTRAEEWIPSFPKNVLLYKSFGWRVPKFIHLPIVLNRGGGKLSKRQGDVSVADFKDKGYLAQALINHSALLGWSPYREEDKVEKKDNIEILSMAELIKLFDEGKINSSPAIFDKDKLDFFNAHYIRQMSQSDFYNFSLPFLEDYWEKKGVKDFRNKFTSKYIEKALSLEQERLKKFSKIGELTEFFFVPEFLINDKLLAWKRMDMDTAKNNLKSLLKELEKIIDNDWSIDNLNDIIVAFLKNNNLSIGEYLWPMRVALTGQKASPGPFEVAWALGKEESVKRIQNAIGE